jgi:hypothetical protein
VNGGTIGSPVTLSSTGTASTTFSEATANTYTLEADYGGDANYSAAVATESLIVTNVKLPVLVNLTPEAQLLSACAPVNFSVHVSSAAGGKPTGTVQLRNGTAAIGSAVLSGGAATLSAGVLSAGTHIFSAAYVGDSLHEPGSSAPVTVTVPSAAASCAGGHPPTVGSVR